MKIRRSSMRNSYRRQKKFVLVVLVCMKVITFPLVVVQKTIMTGVIRGAT
jgi:hypothetical protein